MVTTSPVSLQVQETANAIEDHTRSSQFDDFFNEPEDCTVNTENSDSATFTTSTTTITSDYMMDCFDTSFSTSAEDNWSNVDGNNSSHEEEKKLEGEVVEEEIDTEVMDFGFVDDLGKSCHCSPFEIAEEIMKPMHEDYQIHGDHDPAMLTETMKRMKYERNFSASLYAFNGVSECLKLKEKGKSEHLYTNLRVNEVKKELDEKVQEQVGTPQASTKMGSSSSSSSSSSTKECDDQFSLCSSLDLSPIRFSM
ncbi:hypothetical protein Pint_23575 [Pistacia integerrima]|uniref:Uncharacterized protein n=1 Tax=Pistacia integerrima TaxID=434235 RepID=A0ACC0YMD9_9ROSI|nr:hypothetical protein Pint_23575 [Pistacia integerrima]